MEKNVVAQLNKYRQSPRKVRLVADLIRGQKVVDAIVNLKFITKKATDPMIKLVNSAISNAKDLNLNEDNLFIKSIEVNEGAILHRRRPAARGASHAIHKRTSHIKIVLSEKIQNGKNENKAGKNNKKLKK